MDRVSQPPDASLADEATDGVERDPGPRSWQEKAGAALRIGAMIALAGFLVSQFLTSNAPMEPGNAAPKLMLRSYDGVVWDLDRFAGKPVVVNFWGSWCPPCVSELPDLVASANAYKDEVVFVGAAVTSPPKDVIAMIKRFKIPYPVAATDRPSTGRWQANRYPSTYVLDKDHKLVWSTQGMVSEDKLKAVFEEHLQLAPR